MLSIPIQNLLTERSNMVVFLTLYDNRKPGQSDWMLRISKTVKGSLWSFNLRTLSDTLVQKVLPAPKTLRVERKHQHRCKMCNYVRENCGKCKNSLQPKLGKDDFFGKWNCSIFVRFGAYNLKSEARTPIFHNFPECYSLFCYYSTKDH